MTYTGETPFPCEICLQQFNRKSYLNNHLKIDNGENSSGAV